MESVLHIIHTIVSGAASIGCLVLELFGVAILIFNGVKAFIYYIDKNPGTSVNLGEGIAMGLEFLLAGEVLNTVNASQLSDLYLLGGLVLLRGLMTLEIHWELKHEKEEMKKE